MQSKAVTPTNANPQQPTNNKRGKGGTHQPHVVRWKLAEDKVIQHRLTQKRENEQA